MPKKLSLVPLREQSDRIRSAYERAGVRIVEILSGLDPASFTAVDHGRALRAVQDAIDVLNIQVRSYAPEAIRAAYNESAGVAWTRLEMIGAKKSKRYNQARPEKKIQALIKTILADYWKANRTIEKTARKFLSVMSQAAAGVKKVQQVQMFEVEDALPFIKRLLKKARPADVVEASMARGTVSRQIRDYLLNKLKGEDFIVINGRHYNVRDYAELVARTRMREAQSESTRELCNQFSNDLVQWSQHDSPCEECAPLEGQVFSLSGDDPDYPELTDDITPPLHPRCEHSISPTSRNAISWRGR